MNRPTKLQILPYLRPWGSWVAVYPVPIVSPHQPLFKAEIKKSYEGAAKRCQQWIAKQGLTPLPPTYKTDVDQVLFKLMEKNMITLECSHDYPPTLKHGDDVGFDLYSPETITVAPGSFVAWKTGVVVSRLAAEYRLQMATKSRHAALGVFLVGGVIDPGFRGEMAFSIANLGMAPFTFNLGDPVCQVLIETAHYPAQLVKVNGQPLTPRITGERGVAGGILKVIQGGQDALR